MNIIMNINMNINLKNKIFDITNKYYKFMSEEGWTIVTLAFGEYEILPVKETIHKYFVWDDNEQALTLAAEMAKLHGIICNEHHIVVEINDNQFNNSLYLWQAKELGIL